MADTQTTTSRRRTRPITRWAYAGSRRQVQADVNTSPLTAVLDKALAAALPTVEHARGGV